MTEQTYLLGLSAAVEAARAGVAGIGFGVVPAEVREFSISCRKAALEIGSLADDNAGAVRADADWAKRAAAVVMRLVSVSSDAASPLRGISEGTSRQSRALSEIAGSVETIDRASQRNAHVAQEATNQTSALRHEAAALVGPVCHFRLGGRIPARDGLLKELGSSRGGRSEECPAAGTGLEGESGRQHGEHEPTE